MSKYIELAKKLKALAEQGVGGEKDNAEQMLNKIMKQYGITMDDIESNKRTDTLLEIEQGTEWLIVQVIASCINEKPEVYSTKKPTFVFTECTPSECIEIRAKYDFYLNAYKNDLKLFQHAFIQTNRLYPTPKEEDYKKHLSETLEEREKRLKILGMASKLDSHDYHKQLEKS